MKQRRTTLSLVISILLLISIINIAPNTIAAGQHSLRGFVYIDDALAPNTQIKISFPDEDILDTTSPSGKYQIDFWGHDFETGWFYVYYNNQWYLPIDNQSIFIDDAEQINYTTDLHIDSNIPNPNIPPIADANGPYTAAVNILRTFDASNSYDPDGSIDLYEWDFDGNGIIDNTTTNAITNYTYTSTGSYFITLRVTDNDNDTAIDTTQANVISDITPPSKVTGLTVTNKKNGKLELNWNAATDNVEVQHYKIYRDDVHEYTVNNTLTYLDTGLTNGQEYTYQVSAVDTSNREGEKSDNASGTPTQSTTSGGGGSTPFVNNPPIADANGPYTGNVGEQITFDGSGSTDSDGTIVSWEWDFGDTTSGSGETIIHIYDTPGTYTVTLTVTDDFGNTDDDDTTVTILQPNIPPTTPLITGPKSGDSDTSYDFTALSTDEDNDTLEYTVDWDDGVTDTSDPLESGDIYAITHMWTTGGAYDITVTVSDNQTTSDATHRILIDAEYTEDIGYIVDTNNDDIYDIFHSNETNDETTLGRQNGEYLIDEDSDDDWDWIYNTDTKQLRQYTEPAEIDYALWILLIILIIVILVFAGLVIRSNRIKKQQQKTKKPEKKK